MSYLSDLVRAATGRSVGENIGGAIGGAIGGPGGAAVGAKIGGTTTRLLDRDRASQGQSTAVDVAPEPPRENKNSGETVGNGSSGRFNNPNIFNAVYTVPNTPQRGMTQQANLPMIIGGGSSALRTIGGFLGLAGGAMMVAPTIIDPLTGEEKKLRVTRRLRSQVKKAVEMFGVEAVAESMGTTVNVVFYILTKRMRNDGPYVTKAAVRKTRQTVRKMKHLCDMYDDLRPAARRRAPARKSATTRITNVK
jgi:hypothetical protein